MELEDGLVVVEKGRLAGERLLLGVTAQKAVQPERLRTLGLEFPHWGLVQIGMPRKTLANFKAIRGKRAYL